MHNQPILPISCASGTVDITPSHRLPLAPGDRVTTSSDFVASPLEANVLVLQADENELIIVSCDLLYVGNLLRAQILRGISLEDTPEALFLAASHTHGAPMTQAETRMGSPDSTYVVHVAERIVSLIKRLRRILKPAFVNYHEGLAHHSINRRLKRLRLTRRGLRYGCELGPNPAGERDETIRLLRICDPDGCPNAFLWSYSCHPSASPSADFVCADYPGIVRHLLRHWYGNIPVLFLQGFSGDVRPPFVVRPRGMRANLRHLAHGPVVGRASAEEWKLWSESLGQRVCDISSTAGQVLSMPSLRTVRLSTPWPGLLDGDSTPAKSLEMHLARMGAMRIVGMSAEPVVGYQAMVRSLFPEGPLFTAGCIDQTWGYLPLDSMLADGGYEVNGFRQALGLGCEYCPGIEAQIQQALVVLKQRETQACIQPHIKRENPCATF